MVQATFGDADAVRQALIYSDIFDYPLTRQELYARLPAVCDGPEELDRALDAMLAQADGVASDGTYFFRRGRAHLVQTRIARRHHAAACWRRARRYARLLWCLPYTRMIAVTGALAVDNVTGGDDIDFLIVTAPRRLWMTRGAVLAVCRIARVFGHVLCPNFLLTTRALELPDRDLYTAYELVQMVPLHGLAVAGEFRRRNAWYEELLPNARPATGSGGETRVPAVLVRLKSGLEAALSLPIGDLVESWERNRKIARLRRDAPPHLTEATYSADMCKGHDRGHHQRTMMEWAARLGESRKEHPA